MKCALVTGGSRGIGREICKKLAFELGYHVLINYQGNEAAAKETLALLQGGGASGEIIRFNVADAAAVSQSLQAWQEANPEALVEVIVNNAGITRDGLFMWMPEEDWTTVLDVSLQGFYQVTRFFIQQLLRQRYGRIINMVSVSGAKGTAGQVNYSAAKAGLIGATMALAQEIGKRQVTVNAVAPGFIHSDMTAEMDEKELKKMIPLNRFGEAEEVADLVCFLASPKAGYITGEVIHINGGIYA